eukprot:scaffold186230_cov35-Tisochrysis_lutea.AAC.2
MQPLAIHQSRIRAKKLRACVHSNNPGSERKGRRGGEAGDEEGLGGEGKARGQGARLLVVRKATVGKGNRWLPLASLGGWRAVQSLNAINF